MNFGVVIEAEQLPRVCSRELRFDQLATVPPYGEFSTLANSPFRAFQVAIRSTDFQRHSDAAWGPGRSKLLPHQRLSMRGAAERALLIRVWTRVLEYALANPDRLAQSQVMAFLEAECINALLSCVDATDRSVTSRVSRPAGRHSALSRAVAFINAQIQEPIQISSLCEVAGTSLRPLELAFRECFGVTPKAYINVKRLHGARRDLRASDPGQTSVTTIATRWGFFHLGRFAGEYQRLFGESPRMTLNQRAQPGTLISVPRLEPAWPPPASEPSESRAIPTGPLRRPSGSVLFPDHLTPPVREHSRGTTSGLAGPL